MSGSFSLNETNLHSCFCHRRIDAGSLWWCCSHSQQLTAGRAFVSSKFQRTCCLEYWRRGSSTRLKLFSYCVLLVGKQLLGSSFWDSKICSPRRMKWLNRGDIWATGRNRSVTFALTLSASLIRSFMFLEANRGNSVLVGFWVDFWVVVIVVSSGFGVVVVSGFLASVSVFLASVVSRRVRMGARKDERMVLIRCFSIKLIGLTTRSAM